MHIKDRSYISYSQEYKFYCSYSLKTQVIQFIFTKRPIIKIILKKKNYQTGHIYEKKRSNGSYSQKTQIILFILKKKKKTGNIYKKKHRPYSSYSGTKLMYICYINSETLHNRIKLK